MITSVSLRKTLRTIPALQSLPGWELDAIIAQLPRREYAPGSTLWHAGTRLDFIGIIQEGNVVIECQHEGLAKRSAKLSAGDVVRPRGLTDARGLSFVSAHATSNVTLYVLPLEWLAILHSERPASSVPGTASQGHIRRLPWGKLWALGTIILIALLVWQDITGALAGALYLASAELQNAANYQQALGLLEGAARLDPGALFAYNRAGHIWFQLDDDQLAKASFGKALSVDETSGPARNNLAVIQFATGFTHQAATLQEEAAQSDPDTAVVKYNLGLILMEQNNFVGAIRALKEATRIDPDWELPYIYLAFIYSQMGDYDRAEQAARTAIRLDPSQQSAHLGLAIALYHQNRGQEALLSVEDALLITPDDVTARFYKALIVCDLGRPRAALVMLQELLASSNDPRQRARITEETEYMCRYLQQHPSAIR